MGSDRHYPEEAPVHLVTVDGDWMDRMPVPNRQFKEFAYATGDVTTAETVPDPKNYPGALPSGHGADDEVGVAADRHRPLRLVSQDRGGGYGQAVARGAPEANQVADRWHLMENVSRALLDVVHPVDDADPAHARRGGPSIRSC